MICEIHENDRWAIRAMSKPGCDLCINGSVIAHVLVESKRGILSTKKVYELCPHCFKQSYREKYVKLGAILTRWTK